MKIRVALATALTLVIGGPIAKAAPDCNNLFGQHCLIKLPTGVHMSYFELGSTAGETLILLHTDTTSAVEWAWTAGALLSMDPNLHVFALDQRGAGATDLPNTMPLRQYVSLPDSV
jgi:pimeloyl-ACP methyl ester carboxylesterase